MSTMTSRQYLVRLCSSLPTLLLSLLVTSCTFSPGGLGQNQTLPFEVQKPIFSLTPTHVRELAIEKNDAVSGDRWSIALRSNARGWEISSAGSRPIIDRVADQSFILHFLDTLNTLVYAEPAPQGPASSYGLEPPQFALRTTITPDTGSGGPDRVLDLLIGTAARGTDSQEPSTRFARVPPFSQTMVVHGAAIQMLEMMTSFDSLRKRTVLSFSSDDVDELTLVQAGKEKLYAQRDGDTWTDRKHRKSKSSIREKLDSLTHLRIREFIDDADRAKKFVADTAASPLFEVTFGGRAIPNSDPADAKVIVLRISSLGPDLVATVSNRPGAAFLLFPESLRLFTNLALTANQGVK